MLASTEPLAVGATAPLLTTVLLLVLCALVSAIPGVRTDCPPPKALVNESFEPSFSWAPDSADLYRLAECLQTAIPPPDACVFYTSNMTKRARTYAASRNKTTVYDFYHDRHCFFNPACSPAREWSTTGPGRLRAFYRATSRVYARNCTGSADLVLPSDVTPCPTSIWSLEEQPAICGGESNVREIWHVTPKGAESWARTLVAVVKDCISKVFRLESQGPAASPTGNDLSTRDKAGTETEEELQYHQEEWSWQEDELDDEWAIPETC